MLASSADDDDDVDDDEQEHTEDIEGEEELMTAWSLVFSTWRSLLAVLSVASSATNLCVSGDSASGKPVAKSRSNRA